MASALLAATACAASSTGAEISAPSPTATNSPTQTLTQAEKLKQWEERGVYNAETIEEASNIAGYRVATPAYIPEGFRKASLFMINRMGGGLPEGQRLKFTAITVDQLWMWQSDRLSTIIFTQSDHQFGIDGEPTVFYGRPAERKLTPANGDTPASLAFGWRDGDRWYSIGSNLIDPLDEATLMKIAASVGTR